MSSDSSDATDTEDSGYVHRPEGGDSAVEASVEEGPYTGKTEGEGFGTQGWLLVAGVVVCFLVIPGVIYLDEQGKVVDVYRGRYPGKSQTGRILRKLHAISGG